jgi:hypothetical protein
MKPTVMPGAAAANEAAHVVARRVVSTETIERVFVMCPFIDIATFLRVFVRRRSS